MYIYIYYIYMYNIYILPVYPWFLPRRMSQQNHLQLSHGTSHPSLAQRRSKRPWPSMAHFKKAKKRWFSFEKWVVFHSKLLKLWKKTKRSHLDCSFYLRDAQAFNRMIVDLNVPFVMVNNPMDCGWVGACSRGWRSKCSVLGWWSVFTLQPQLLVEPLQWVSNTIY